MADNRVLDSNTTVEFDFEGNMAGVGISIVPDPTYIANIGSGATAYEYYLRLYRGDKSCIVKISDGYVFRLEVEAESIENEGVVFSGGDTAGLEYPVVGSVTFNNNGTMFSPEGDEISPKIIWDGRQVRASEPCYGMVNANYTTKFERLGVNYRHTATPLGFYGMAYGAYAGTVYAFCKDTKETASYKMPDYPFLIPNRTPDKVEVLRIISYVQVTERGVYERHKDWPNSTFVPYDYDNYVMDVKRTHEVLYVDTLGRVHSEKYHIKPETPFNPTSPNWVTDWSKRTGESYPKMEMEEAPLSQQLPYMMLESAKREIADRKAQGKL
jgi:hypothetical protein